MRGLRILRVGSRIAMLLIVIGAAYGVGELWLRTTRADAVYTEIDRHPPHPFMQVTPAMAVDHVDAQGFRGDDVALVKPPKTFRIFTIGGSTTLGVSNPYPDSYPFLLQALLREKYPDVN